MPNITKPVDDITIMTPRVKNGDTITCWEGWFMNETCGKLESREVYASQNPFVHRYFFIYYCLLFALIPNALLVIFTIAIYIGCMDQGI
jgi:hypothetical protein